MISEPDLSCAARRLRVPVDLLRRALLSPPCEPCRGDGVRLETEAELRARPRGRKRKPIRCPDCGGDGFP